MKFSLLISAAFCALYLSAQPERQEISTIGYVEVMFKDSSEVWAMMWDDFTFEYSENHSEIIVVEGGSNKTIKYKAKDIEFIQFLNDGEKVVLKKYKSPQGRNHVLLHEIYKNGDYILLESPSFSLPIYTYIGFKGEVINILPKQRQDFLDFFGCEKMYASFGQEQNTDLSKADIIELFQFYLDNCLVPEIIPEAPKED